jgi:hypothetical protein
MASRLSTLSRGIIASMLSLSLLQGCASTHHQEAYQDPGIKNSFVKGLLRGSGGHQTRWDPPEWQGYGARIPNMEGDWDRFCKADPSKCG